MLQSSLLELDCLDQLLGHIFKSFLLGARRILKGAFFGLLAGIDDAHYMFQCSVYKVDIVGIYKEDVVYS